MRALQGAAALISVPPALRWLHCGVFSKGTGGGGEGTTAFSSGVPRNYQRLQEHPDRGISVVSVCPVHSSSDTTVLLGTAGGGALIVDLPWDEECIERCLFHW